MVEASCGQACCSVGRAERDIEAFVPEIGDNAGDFRLEIGKRPHNFDCVYIHAFFDNQSHNFSVREGCAGSRSHCAKHVSGGVR